MVTIKKTIIQNIKFPSLQLEKGDWISLAFPSVFNAPKLLGAYCKHIEASSEQGIFKTRKVFTWLNLTHTNPFYSRIVPVEELIKKEKDIDTKAILQYAKKELEIDVSRNMQSVDATKRVLLLYQLQKEKVDLIVASIAGMEPWGAQQLWDWFKEEQAENRVIELCHSTSRVYSIAKESQLVKLVKEGE